MGCFSFRCGVCDDPINSNSFSGENCVLLLLDKGKVIEYMAGQYDSYGRVFKAPPVPVPGNPTLTESQEWETMIWSGAAPGELSVCGLMHNDEDDSGIAAYHTHCLYEQSDPFTFEVSDGDPEQGWGDYKHPTDGPHYHGIGPRP